MRGSVDAVTDEINVDAEGAEDLVRHSLEVARDRAVVQETRGLETVVANASKVTQLSHRRLHSRSRTELVNYGDVQYVGSIKVGGQTVNGVLDTGSFDLLVFSSFCEACGDKSLLYDHSRSKTHVGTTYEMRHSFGSGDTWSREARDTVEIGSLVAEEQPFWEVFRTAMPVIRHAAFQAIVGLGPIRSAARLAKQQHEVVLEEEREYMRDHSVLPEKLRKDEIDAMAAVKHSRQLTGLLQNVDMHTFSVCIGSKLGSNGFFVWNDADPRLRPNIFTKVSDENSMHWVVKMTDVRIGHGMYGDPKVLDIGCGGGQECGVIMDTGTSLIAAPKEAITRVRELVGRIDGNCSRVNELPDLRFNLGGTDFSLPAESYVGRVEGTIPTALSRVFQIRHDVQRVTATTTMNETSCQPLLMAVDAQTMFGQMWIFGLPFFRRYYTTFDTRRELVRFGNIARKQIRNSVFIAPADARCKPRGGSSLLTQGEAPREVITVDMSQVRFPNLDAYESDGRARAVPTPAVT